MELIKGLKIPGKQGPFYVRKLNLEELFTFHRVKGDEHDRIRHLVQMTLCAKNGKPIYTDKQVAKMERDLGGVRLLDLANRAKNVNEFDLLAGVSDAVEDAEKN